jgi:hypothetical protein
MERYNLKKLNDVKGKAQYHVYTSNRFAALRYFDINKTWKTFRISKFHPEIVYFIMNLIRISRGSMKDAQNYYTNGNKANCSGYKTEVK